MACSFSPRLFHGWAEVVRSFEIELPETPGVPAVFRGDGLDFYLMPVTPDAPGAPSDLGATGNLDEQDESGSEARPEPSECPEPDWPEEDEEVFPADDPQDGPEEPPSGPPDNAVSPGVTREPSSSLSAPSSGAMAMAETSDHDQDQGNTRRAPRQRRGRQADESAAQDGKPERAKRPARTIRMGRIRAAIWRNQTESGVLYNTTFERIYKVDDERGWQSSESFGPNDLLLLAKVADMAHTWIMRQQGAEDGY
jgi:hypothetical protein